MAEFAFNDVQVLFIDPDGGSRDSIRHILQNNGFRLIKSGSSFRDLVNGTSPPGPDLVVCEIDLLDGDVSRWIYDMRHQLAGPDPFLPVIAITWTPTPEIVRRVINAGADDLLTKPLSSDLLIGRIRQLVRGRKPFIVTNDYVGPDRHRTAERPNAADLIDVPNRLRARSMGDVDPEALSRQINDALNKINRHKINIHVSRIVQMIDRLVPLLDQGLSDSIMYRELRRLYEAVEDLNGSLNDQDQSHVSDLCRSLLGVIETIRQKINSPSRKDIHLLDPLAKAIQAGVSGRNSTVFTAHQIHAALGTTNAFFDAETTRYLNEAADKVESFGQERRQKFLLRLLIGKISHLLSDHLGRQQVIPRAFLNGFDEYLMMLLGQQFYDELNPRAEELLGRISSDDDFHIWRVILSNDEYFSFSYTILVQILLKFRPFSRGKRNFMAIINMVITDSLKILGKYDGRDAFTDGHFNLVFATLFSDIFNAIDTEKGQKEMDVLIGPGTASELLIIHAEYRACLHAQKAQDIA